MKRAFLAAAAAAFLFHFADHRLGAQVPDDLKFFKNYFVTGDYEVRGVGFGDITAVNGFANGTINIPADNPATAVREGVPLGADIHGVYLYWQVVSDTGPNTGSLGVKFRGFDLASPEDPSTPQIDAEPFGKVLAFEGQASCSNPGGGTGDGPRRTYTYRLDAARFFPVDENPSSPYFGKTVVTGAHTISVPHRTQGQQMPVALGASLMIMFRYPDRPEYAAQKNVLNAIVIYDDGVSLGNAQQSVIQDIKGFYQPSATPNARISYIVGSGDPAKREDLTLPGTLVGTSSNLVLDPFNGSDPTPPGISGSRWDTETYAINLTNPETLSQVSTTLALNNTRSGGRDCLTVAAMVFKTAVKDSDGDGPLDVWEMADGTADFPELYDPNGKMLPLLGKMGAKWNHKDMFIELGAMKTFGTVSYAGELRPQHSHMPRHEELKLVGDTFKNAPVSNLDGIPGIAVHFDAGAAYPSCPAPTPANPNPPCADAYLIRTATATTQLSGTVPVATGGELVDEMATVCQRLEGEAPWVCQFGYGPGQSVSDANPGTVGWKTGYRFIRDELLNITPTPPTTPTPEDFCDTPIIPPPASGPTKYACTFRFDPNRRDIFRYVFSAHALGLPKSAEMFLADGETPNPDFHRPRTNTGIGDFLGGDALLTLGAFVDYDNVSPVGTPFQWASTAVHEIGHTLGRRHNGDTLEPNCTPQYFSTMNYVYQLRGVIPNTGPNIGIPTINLSSNAYPSTSFDELSLTDGDTGLSASAPFRMSWYAPIVGPLAGEPGVTRVQRHCDGSLIPPTYSGVDGATDAGGHLLTTSGSIPLLYVGGILTITQGPNAGNYLITNVTATTVTISGTFATTGSNQGFTLNQNFVRIDTGNLAAVDWNADGDVLDAQVQDINFDGLADTGPFSLRGSSDWDKVRLNQVGSRRSPGGYFYIYNPNGTVSAIGVGPLSLGSGKGDLGSGDLSDYALGQGKGDLGGGKGDLGLGKGDLGNGKGDLGNGKGDLGIGKGDLGSGKGDLGNGKGDLGLGDEGGGDFFGDEGEVDDALAADLTLVPPNQVKACQNCAPAGSAPDPTNFVRVSWTAPTVAGIVRYTPYRALVLNTTTGQTGPWTQLSSVPVPAGAGQPNRNFFFIDPDSHKLVNGRTYAYQVTATYRVKNHDTPNPIDYKEVESNGSSPDALVALPPVGFVNAPPEISNIVDQRIRRNSSIALPFTVRDTESVAADLSVPPPAVISSTNAALTSQISFALSGTGGNRTLTVTHSGDQRGTVTVRLQVTDTQCTDAFPPDPCTPGTAIDTFNVEVRP